MASSITRNNTRVVEGRCEDFLYNLKASQRAAACGGRPRPGSATTATGDRPPPSRELVHRRQHQAALVLPAVPSYPDIG
jgi:hypothetical protein